MKKNLLKKHAKSFYWASFFLSNNTLDKCSSLYNFCRTLDDIVDDSNNLNVKKGIFSKFKKDFENKNLDNQIIKDNVVSDFYLTPDYFEIDLATLYGSGFSIQPKFSQSAYFRFHNQSEIYKNLYFVGAGTHPGAGMPGVLSSAKVLDNLF